MKTGRPRKHPMLKTEKYARAQECAELEPLQNPDVPPSGLNGAAQEVWKEFIPKLVKAGKIFEINRMPCCALVNSYAKLLNESDPKECRLAAEVFLQFCEHFALTPISMNKVNGLTGNTQPIESRKR